ncbi:hypothetical protein MHM93_05805 [Pseudoalteromonas sp. MM17-2]|uniref:hypothetical protein n=1 Tax=Pseudoalteromonas sp. MM17-2 TaxID=2917753 RepID=UPI001EF3FF14|nr:hypothetical protein [Pseudoalteromonas sp. MM17-2]MCG7543697.1 hypothetical protein [Pseudoalteromonas sp. MM17-2]
MRNLLIFAAVIIGLVWWASQYLINFGAQANDKELSMLELNPELLQSEELDVEQLANTLGVEYEPIVAEQISEPEFKDLRVSLVAIYKSGEQQQARVRVSDGDTQTMFNLSAGEQLEHFTVVEIKPTQVLFEHDQESFVVKMYKSASIRVQNSKEGGEVNNGV